MRYFSTRWRTPGRDLDSQAHVSAKLKPHNRPLHLNSTAQLTGATVEFTPTGLGWYDLVLTATDAEGVVVRATDRLMCKYVRRELRTLSDDDRTAMLDALGLLEALTSGRAGVDSALRAYDAGSKCHLWRSNKCVGSVQPHPPPSNVVRSPPPPWNGPDWTRGWPHPPPSRTATPPPPSPPRLFSPSPPPSPWAERKRRLGRRYKPSIQCASSSMASLTPSMTSATTLWSRTKTRTSSARARGWALVARQVHRVR